MGIRDGKPEILRELGCSEGVEEKSKPARFKNRSMRHPQLAQRPRACHPPAYSNSLSERDQSVCSFLNFSTAPNTSFMTSWTTELRRSSFERAFGRNLLVKKIFFPRGCSMRWRNDPLNTRAKAFVLLEPCAMR